MTVSELKAHLANLPGDAQVGQYYDNLYQQEKLPLVELVYSTRDHFVDLVVKSPVRHPARPRVD